MARNALKLLRYLAYSLLALACIVGGLVGMDIIPKQPLDSLPPALRTLLFVCFLMSCIAVVYGFIDDYRRIRRARETPRE